ncbi:DUF2975 domain-containing protein [Ruminococcus sp. OA3]|uniref:DUF2975 domain-containing protein n=1 Tax=Ruminococcus sp. OA3 TaxID=2914164 RepID=UPI001F06BF61|nr:DUF2975 domain-containing protein [Ruminococcus sp. OA3]MCH1981376.1 DUF2975 domain-containing protein [Ruminococcus sp. OA3]
MNWNKDKSLALSQICVWIFAVLLAAGAVGAPWMFRMFIGIRGGALDGTLPYFLISTYTTVIPVTTALILLYRLLGNIKRGDVFQQGNVRCLRGLSWCCLAAGLICLISTVYYLPFLALAVMAVFMSLILRVIKNVFAEALALKEENDYTI